MNPGDQLPDFKAYDQDWNEFHSNELLDSPSVIFFYPKDNTPGCVREACSFRDNIEEFTSMGARVIGISADNPETHKQFAERYLLPYTLIYDKGEIKELFSVKSSLFGIVPSRETFIFDSRGTLTHHFANQLQPDKHIAEGLKAVKALKKV